MSQTHMAIYRNVWRWHFYAGIVVAPFMLLLAITGAIYLFNDEINDALYPELRFAATSGQSLPLSAIATGALGSFPGGAVTRIDTPTAHGRTFQVYVTPSAGDPVRVFVDPASGRAQGTYFYPHTLIGIADLLHGSLLMGDFGDAIVEIVACWGLILVATGTYLWWPRGLPLRRALLPRFDSSGRHFWKSLHGAIGIWSAFLIAFLILTGLPWATVWGDMFRKVTAMAGIGYPASVRTHGAPASTSLTVKDVANGAAPWTLETMPAPLSDEHAGHHSGGSAPAVAAGNRVDLDRVAAVVDAHKMTEPYRLVFPRNAAGVFSAYTYPDQPEGQRSLYIDQYSGKVVRDVGFKDYGIAAKAVELGVQLHMGNYFGRLNQIVMLIPCVGIVVLAITGPYMWWQRRPKGMFGAPKVVEPTTLRSFALITLAMAALFPLAGASLVAVGVLDAIGSRFLGPRQPAA